MPTALRATMLGAALLLLAPATAHAEDAPKRGGELKVAVVAEANMLDCHQANTFAVIHHLAPHYSTLLKFDPANYPKIVGDLARDWSESADHLTYTAHLHPGITFHDGSPLTARDVAATYERLKDPPAGINSVRRDHFRDVTAIETPDPETIVFKLGQPNVAFPVFLADPSTASTAPRN